MVLNQVPLGDIMFLANNDPRHGQGDGLATDHTGQQFHVSGVFIILLELVLVVENLFPILVVALWLPPTARGVGDRLVAAFSLTCILSALVPTPLGLASYFSGGWYGGAPTCTTYQVTSIWCNLSSLCLLTYICVNCQIAVRRLVKLKPPDKCPSCHRSVLAVGCSASESASGQVSSRQGEIYGNRSGTAGSERVRDERNQYLEYSKQRNSPRRGGESNGQCNGVSKKLHQKLSSGTDESTIVLGYAENSLVDIDSDDEAKKMGNITAGNGKIQYIKGDNYIAQNDKTASTKGVIALETKDSYNVKPYSRAEDAVGDLDASESLITQNSQSVMNGGASLLQTNNPSNGIAVGEPPTRANPCSNLDQHYGPESQSSILGAGECHTRDYVSLALFFLFSVTLGISSLPVAGFGPNGMPDGEKSCTSWLVPTPLLNRERVFFLAFLTVVYLCLLMGCCSGICVCMQVSKRMKLERRRKTRLYHEEENVPDLGQLYVLDCMRRHYSMACIVMAGILTWVPSTLMLTLQKSGVEVSEPTLMYSNIATSLPGLLNPLLYSLALARYRTGYKALIEKCCCKRRKLKPHPMKKVQTSLDPAPSATTNVEVTIDPAGQRHLCLHGTSNPTFNSELDQLLQVDEDEDLDDEDIEDDEDYCPEDSDSPDQEPDLEGPKPDAIMTAVTERTPLHAVSMATSGVGQSSFRTVLVNRPASHKFSNRELKSIKADKEALLVSSSSCVDDETGL
ncbi:hypothetical protein EGW08_011339 [Elysia chlorotica]|uniref:G-protein coupled receptors family 1 profile domain-containing protein n=1 Tax=Elysia chlorotica TaxID=188477 RepID=A0A433TH87_ELYCH|nr:hypothetical protein EGW08_011339 [Elysia chlorotica]